MRIFIAVFLSLYLSACGGGGSSPTNDSFDENGVVDSPESDQVGSNQDNESGSEPLPTDAGSVDAGWTSPTLLVTSNEVDGYDIAYTESGKAIAATYSSAIIADVSLDTIRYDPATGWGEPETFLIPDGPVGGEDVEIGLTESDRAVVYDESSPNQLMYIPSDGWQSVRFLRPNFSRFFSGCCDDRGFTFLEPVGFTSLKPTSIEFEDYDPDVGARSSRSMDIPVYDPMFNYRIISFGQKSNGEFFAVDALTRRIGGNENIVFRESLFIEGVWTDPQVIYEFTQTDTLSQLSSIVHHRSTNGNMILGWSQRAGRVGTARSKIYSAVRRIDGVWESVAVIDEVGSDQFSLLHVSIDNSGHSIVTVSDGSSVLGYSAPGDVGGSWDETNPISGFFDTIVSDSTIGDEASIKLFTRPDGRRFLIGMDRFNRDMGLSIQQYDASNGWGLSTFLQYENNAEQRVRGFRGRISNDGNVVLVVRQGEFFWVSNNKPE